MIQSWTGTPRKRARCRAAARPRADDHRSVYRHDWRDVIARILIIDRSRDTRDIFALLFEEERHTTMTAETAEQAIAICRESPPDVVLIDPFEETKRISDLVTRLREICAGAKIVVFSESPPSVDIVAEARELRADLVLRKPVMPEALIAAVTTVLGDAGPAA